ncbi:hypothetical protein F4810DRAFT_146986 [Camillea tinctor]|nr:hypothetical protein F4810DRAFT_146986 [Camillea tinctor]
MHPLIPLFLLFSLVSASPATTWTAHNVHRSKNPDQTVCTWHLEITTPSSNTTCHFDVHSPSGTDCGLQSLGDRNTCMGAMQSAGGEAGEMDSPLIVGGGHSDQGFVVVVAVDEDRGTQAYFGFADTDLDGAVAIPAQAASVYPVNNGGNTRRTATGEDMVWSVSDMYRHTDPAINAVNISFFILEGDNPELTPCELNLAAPEGADLATWQWYDQQCEGSDYYASWGYMNAADAGIMTLVNPARDSNAYFGFANINSVESLGSAGPNPVSPCNCG